MAEGAEIIDLEKVRSDGQLRDMLQKSEKGAPLGNVSNLILIISHDAVLYGMCAYDEFKCLPVMQFAAPSPVDGLEKLPGPYPRSWSAADVSQVQAYIQRIWVPSCKKGDVEDAMLAVGSARRFHPVRDWLGSLVWDGKKRVDDWLKNTFGAKDDAFTDDVASCFLIAAVRRVRQPGVKHDHMMILEGNQGIGKSTALKILFGDDWFTDNVPSQIESKDAAQSLQGVWCIEFAEIEQIIRTEVEVIKAFLSRAVDRFRAPYGRTFLTYPRQCVTFGTTNDTDYLRDATGNRRFWPVWCNKVDLDWITQNRVQLWAEAAKREAQGERHWLTEQQTLSQATETQSSRMQEDVWEDKVKNFVKGGLPCKTAEILEALSIPIKDQSRREQMRVAAIMKRLGWKMFVGKKDDKSAREWREVVEGKPPERTEVVEEILRPKDVE